MKALLYALPGNESFAARLATELAADPGALNLHRFPDGEVLVRLDTSPQDRDVAMVCTLADPERHILALLFAADAARAQGARSVGLIAPYLAYLRQDRVFHRGEALTSAVFARLISSAFDWLVTVDPHLHRYHSLAEVYTIPAESVPASPDLARWIRANVRNPLLIGPDEESAQWVSAIGVEAGAPYTTLAKQRLGDREVRIALPDLGQWQGHTPVLVDDIISTGRTMAEALRVLKSMGIHDAVCAASHAIFAGNAYQDLAAAGAGRIVTTNSVPHESNRIDVSRVTAAAALRLIAR